MLLLYVIMPYFKVSWCCCSSFVWFLCCLMFNLSSRPRTHPNISFDIYIYICIHIYLIIVYFVSFVLFPILRADHTMAIIVTVLIVIVLIVIVRISNNNHNRVALCPPGRGPIPNISLVTPSPPTKSLGFEGFDSSRLLILRGGNSHVRGTL